MNSAFCRFDCIPVCFEERMSCFEVQGYQVMWRIFQL